MAKHRYAGGQRWRFRTNVPEFEDTLVIETAYNDYHKVYVRFSPLAAPSIPARCDGVVLTLTKKGLDRVVTRLVETGVRLPWWWQSGYRAKSRAEMRTSWSSYSVPSQVRLTKVLVELFNDAREKAENTRGRAAALENHLRKFRARSSKRPPSKSIAESWSRIAAWLAEHAPGYSFPLLPGATAAAIRSFEKVIGARLPDDYKESLRIHDGGGAWIPPYYGDFLSLEQILKEWQMYRDWQQRGEYAAGDDWDPTDIKGPIKPIFWNLKRIFITDNSGDHLTLDLDPPAKGNYGQLLHHSHEVGPTRVVARCWTDFLRQLVQDFESGNFVYVEFTLNGTAYKTLEPLDRFQK